MKRMVDGCVGCGLPCIGDQCSYRNEVEYFCDVCGDPVNPNELYFYPDSGEELCAHCLLGRFATVSRRCC